MNGGDWGGGKGGGGGHGPGQLDFGESARIGHWSMRPGRFLYRGVQRREKTGDPDLGTILQAGEQGRQVRKE